MELMDTTWKEHRRLSRGCGKKSAKEMEEMDCDASVTGSSKIYDKV